MNFKRMLKKLDIALLIPVFCITSFHLCNCSEDDDSGPGYVPGTAWTIMIYGDGDNNLEGFLLNDIEEMKNGYVNDQEINLIVLADRHPADYETPAGAEETTGLGSNFSDTRLYRITEGKATRISGKPEFSEITTKSDYEANMGDALTLKKFIRFSMSHYPAENYALILWNHGDGPRKKGGDSGGVVTAKSICEDLTDGDYLYTAEITDVLSADESVTLLGFDACLMGSVEVAYQYRPGNGGFNAEYMAASPASEWGFGWRYDRILERLQAAEGDNGESAAVTGGYEAYYDPVSMGALDFCGVIVEEQYDSTQVEDAGIETPVQTLSCYDLSYVDEVKDAVDEMAVALTGKQSEFEALRGQSPLSSSSGTMHYFNALKNSEWLSLPFFDLYDLSKRTSEDSTNFSPIINNLASSVMTAVDNMIVYSFGGSSYPDFQPGKNGLHIFFPDGDTLTYTGGSGTFRHWAYQWWYNALDTNIYYATGFLYGKLAWCDDGATESNGVENWFEMLDSWFDTANDTSNNNLNSYKY